MTRISRTRRRGTQGDEDKADEGDMDEGDADSEERTRMQTTLRTRMHRPGRTTARTGGIEDGDDRRRR